MKKLGLTLLTALVGGLIAVGGYKLFEGKQESKMSFEDRQQLHYASNTIPDVVSSTGNPDFTQAAAMVAPAVVHITTTYPGRSVSRGQSGDPFDLFEEFFGMPRQRQQPRQQPPAQATGSGVIISADGYIITNNHVVEDADKIEVQLTDKRTMEAKVIGRDPNTDLALIKINEKGLPFVRFGNSDEVRIGEWVLAVGYPLGLESTVTAGIVSATGRSTGIIARELMQRQYQQGYGQQGGEPFANTAVESFIQTDAVINKGNSGGPLVNAQGELIGINSNIMTPTGTYAGYGFAVPVNIAKKIADDFIKFGAVKRGLIGIQFRDIADMTSEEIDQYGIDNTSGLYVADVVADGAAEKAGLKKGDIITKLDDQAIQSSSQLQTHVYLLHPGDKVKLTYERDGKERSVTVTLQEDKGDTGSSESNSGSDRSGTEIYNKLGAGFVPASDAKKKELGVSSGVVVTQVHRDGLFDYFNVQRGLVITEINGQPVNNIDEVENALANSARGIIHIVGVPQRGSRVELRIPIEY